jgi:hypothetical protein
VLEAIAAAPAVDQLRFDIFQVERYRPAEQDVEVLEQDVRRVRQVQRVEHRARRFQLAAVADALEIRLQIQVAHGRVPPRAFGQNRPVSSM